jgi:hypothetical protein
VRMARRLKRAPKMTLIGTSGTRALPDLLLYAALKRRSSTVLQGPLHKPWKIEVKIKVKSSGQECPLHTCRADRHEWNSCPSRSSALCRAEAPLFHGIASGSTCVGQIKIEIKVKIKIKIKIKIETRSKERSKSKSKAAASALHWPVYFRGLYVLFIAWESGVGSENCAALGAAFFVGAQNARGLGRTP